jgi:hypothetical protein
MNNEGNMQFHGLNPCRTANFPEGVRPQGPGMVENEGLPVLNVPRIGPV